MPLLRTRGIDQQITIRDIVEETGFLYHRVHNILETELGMKKLTARWVPRMLTLAQKRQRTVLCEQHLTNFRTDRKLFIERYVTMDETWVHHYGPETKIQSMQWKYRGQRPEEIQGAPISRQGAALCHLGCPWCYYDRLFAERGHNNRPLLRRFNS